MKRNTKIFILIVVISVASLTALDIQTKGKVTSLIGSVNPMDLKSSDVPYTNNSQSTVQGAIDDLYSKAILTKDGNFLEAYTYNQTEGTSNYCVTGNESTCQETTCYKTKSAGACPGGTIITYKVRPGKVVTFHVMYDDANTITMQAQRNTIYNIAWITKEDYGVSSDYSVKGDRGPLTILPALESATAGWTNVNDQTYTMGTTIFKTNAYTGCSEYDTCGENTYTLESRTAKSRMITVQEAVLLGCTPSYRSCPKWMYNYLENSTSYGGTENDISYGPNEVHDYGYYSMNIRSKDNFSSAWVVTNNGMIFFVGAYQMRYGARAVVVVNKQ